MFSDNAGHAGRWCWWPWASTPTTSTPDDWQKAADLLTKQKDAGIVRQYYDQSYIDALENGDIAITMAWSGDIFQAEPRAGTPRT